MQKQAANVADVLRWRVRIEVRKDVGHEDARQQKTAIFVFLIYKKCSKLLALESSINNYCSIVRALVLRKSLKETKVSGSSKVVRRS